MWKQMCKTHTHTHTHPQRSEYISPHFRPTLKTLRLLPVTLWWFNSLKVAFIFSLNNFSLRDKLNWQRSFKQNQLIVLGWVVAVGSPFEIRIIILIVNCKGLPFKIYDRANDACSSVFEFTSVGRSNSNDSHLAVGLIANGRDYTLYVTICLKCTILQEQFCLYHLSQCNGTEETMLKMTACQIGQNMPVVVGVEK